MPDCSGLESLPPTLLHKLLLSGYSTSDDLTGRTFEEFLATCRLNLKELTQLRHHMEDAGVCFRPGAIRYPFVSPLLLQQVESTRIDLSQTSIGMVGLPGWATTALMAGGIETLQQLVETSTFYVRSALGFGGRPQNIVRQRVEEYLIRLLGSVGDLKGPPEAASAGPLHELSVQPRTLHALRRAGIFTVQQLQRLSGEELARLKGLGPKGVADIQSALPSAPQLPISEPDIAVQAEAVSVRPEVASRPVSDLRLPKRLLVPLKTAGLTTIGDLVRGGTEQLNSVPGVGKLSERRIRTALEQYLLAALADVGETVPETVAEIQAEAVGSSLDDRIQNLIRQAGPPRITKLLRSRFGLSGRVWTLEEAGRELGISRERARQLERAALDTLRREHAEALHDLSRPAHEALAEVGGVAPFAYMVAQLPSLYPVERIHPLGAARFLIETARDCARLPGGLCILAGAPMAEVASVDDGMVTLLRKRLEPLSLEELTTHLARTSGYPTVVQWYPSFSLAARGRANPETYVLPSGAIALLEWRRTRMDNAVRALRTLGRPSHYRQIAAQVQLEAMDEAAIGEESMHNLLLNEAAFVRVGRGIFGLAEWQQEGTGTARKVEDLLRDADRPMHRSEMARKLSLDERTVERHLIAGPEFSPAGHGYYKLTSHTYATTTSASRSAHSELRGRRATVRELASGPAGSHFARIRVSAATRRSGALALNAALLVLFPVEEDLRAAWPASTQSQRTFRLHRGRSHISGLSRFIHSEKVMPGDCIYIERTGGPDPVYNLYTDAQWRATVISNLTPEESTSSSES